MRLSIQHGLKFNSSVQIIVQIKSINNKRLNVAIYDVEHKRFDVDHFYRWKLDNRNELRRHRVMAFVYLEIDRFYMCTCLFINITSIGLYSMLRFLKKKKKTIFLFELNTVVRIYYVFLTRL